MCGRLGTCFSAYVHNHSTQKGFTFGNGPKYLRRRVQLFLRRVFIVVIPGGHKIMTQIYSLFKTSYKIQTYLSHIQNPRV